MASRSLMGLPAGPGPTSRSLALGSIGEGPGRQRCTLANRATRPTTTPCHTRQLRLANSDVSRLIAALPAGGATERLAPSSAVGDPILWSWNGRHALSRPPARPS
jgi:hypothetical protein